MVSKIVSSLILFAVVSSIGIAAKEIPIEEFMRPSELSQVRLSPCGGYIAMRRPTNDRHDFFLINIDTNEGTHLKVDNGEDIGYIEWVGDERILMFLRGRVYVANTENTDTRRISIPNRGSVIDPIIHDNQSILFVGYRNRDGDPQIHHLNPLSGRYRTQDIDASTIPGQPLKWLSDGLGNLMGCAVYTAGKTDLFFYDESQKTWSSILPAKLPWDSDFDVHHYDRAEKAFWVVAYGKNEQTASLFKVPANSSQQVVKEWQHSKYDIFNACDLKVNPYTGTVQGIRFEEQGPKVEWFDETLKLKQKIVDDAFYATENIAIDQSEDGNRMLFSCYSDRVPAFYIVIDFETGEIVFNNSSLSNLDPLKMAANLPVNFTTKDGLSLEGYLTLPGPQEEGPYPTVALVHGGPWSRDTWGFDPVVQLLANRGYAVFQLNFRGSRGYSRSLFRDHAGDFLGMVSDVIDGTKRLVNSGIADPERLAIMGASFGGYAAVAAQMIDPNLYNCSIAFVGPFDMEMRLKNLSKRMIVGDGDNYGYDFWKRVMGDPGENADYYRKISPVHHADRITRPVLLAHGRADTNVDIDHTKAMARALRKAGNPAETLYLHYSGHGFASLRDRMKFYEKALEFLEEHL
ncbi:MAG: alpha/beta fold hydrolase [Verrucomicrobiota bacterium]